MLWGKSMWLNGLMQRIRKDRNKSGMHEEKENIIKMRKRYEIL